ncbi:MULTISPECIES: hypothetical protein [Olivibacter]|uniref:Uncharacterized protein n=1 Tax=Olivibacter jilunii TaxID=985016 RepID=A0ABW6AZW2_9SPHI
MKKLSYIEQIRRVTRTNQERVMSLLGWDDLQYAQYQEEMGYLYLSHEYGDTPFINELPYTSAFWKWFKNQWAKREQIFLLAADTMSYRDRLKAYKALHNPESFEFHPHRKIMEKSYANMISNVIKEVVR